MTDKIEFGKEEYRLLLELKDDYKNLDDFRVGMELRNEALEKELQTLKRVVARMVWASTKVTAMFAGIFGGATWLGFWLTNSDNYNALKSFFSAISKDK